MTNNQELIAEAEAHVAGVIRQGGCPHPILDRLIVALKATSRRTVPLWRCEFCSYPYPADEGNPSKYARCLICGGEGFELEPTETDPPSHSLDHMFGDVPAQLAALSIRKEGNDAE